MKGEPFSRRRLLAYGGALSALAVPDVACAQFSAPPKRPAVKDEFYVTEPVAIEVNARPIASFDPRDRSHVRFGSLEWRSGLVLTSSFHGFGGLSAWRLDPKGERFVSLSDKGSWFTGRIVYSGKEMTGLVEVEAAPMLWMDGKPITSHGWFDSESLAFDGTMAYVGLERVNQVMRFDFSKGVTRARGEIVPMPGAVRRLPFNKGLEALVWVPKGKPLGGTLIAFSERGLDSQGNLIAFLVGGPSAGQFSVRRSDDFDISDAVLLTSGDVLILERKFSWLAGLRVRLRRIPLTSFAPGAAVDGPSIFEADLGQEIDNLEGIDAHVTAEGETVLTMVSDDNFSMLQRTLLLQFTLVE